jgi:hypothetical protein
MTGTSRQTSYEAWTEHRFFKYRGCAPDVDDPRRAAGDPSLSLDAWLGEDRDGGEPQQEREARYAAAKAVCRRCPVLAECDAFADTVTADGKLAEPVGVRGGRTALERHRRLIATRAREGAVVVAPSPAPDRMLRTPQKQALLRALAECWEPVEVMERADLPDVRTANWQRSQLVRLLGLPKGATRMQLLQVAGDRGLLDGVKVVADDGTVRAVPKETQDVLQEVQRQRLLWLSKRSEMTGVPGRREPVRGVRAPSFRRRFPHVSGQQELPLLASVESAGDVCELAPDFPVLVPAGLEAVA